MTLAEFEQDLKRIEASGKDCANLPLYGNIYGKIVPIVSFKLEHGYQPNMLVGNVGKKEQPTHIVTVQEALILCTQIEARAKLTGNKLLPVCVEWSRVSTVMKTQYCVYKSESYHNIVIIN